MTISDKDDSPQQSHKSERLSFFRSGGTPRVKFCGFTREEDVVTACRLVDKGLHALGFNLWQPSKRFISLEKATALAEKTAELAPSLARIAVVVNPEKKLLQDILDAKCFDAVQFHGDETPAACAEFEKKSGLLWLKALTAGADLSSYATPWILLDTPAGKHYGGTGKVFDWQLAANAVTAFPKQHIFLAGGLTSENIAEALETVIPYGIDIAGGIESAPGQKDESKMKALLTAVQVFQSRS
ncbi:MAG: phosphoribosylanthranilate isomerase [Chthoniobacterales bacterium]